MRMLTTILIASLALSGCTNEDGAADGGRALDGSSIDARVAGDGGGADGEVAIDAQAPSDGGGAGAELVGWWVWKEQRDGDTVTPITEEDMAWMVGPSGWPGCPEGISCTRTGIMVVGFSAEGRAHVMHRVTTGSDTQHPATWTTSGDLLTYHRTEQLSCAHPPGGSTANAGDFYARWRREGADLWLSVEGFGGLPFASSEPGAEPARWIVFRPITQAEAHGRYDHPYCGAARKGVEACHPLCASSDVLADAT